MKVFLPSIVSLKPAARLVFVCLFVWLAQACTRNNGQSLSFPAGAGINIFNASHVYDSMRGSRKIFLSGFDTTNTNARLVFSATGNYEVPANGWVEAIRYDHAMRFLSFMPGQQRLQMADTSGNIVADTSLLFPDGNYTGIYIADDTTHGIPSFTRTGRLRIFSFPEQRTHTPGKLRLRYINLVPDLDTLNGYVFTSASTKYTGPEMPKDLTYGKASSYYDIDTTGLVVGGQVLLRFYRRRDTANVRLQVPIPAIPGRSYTIVTFGNAGYFLCQFPVKQADGSTKQKFFVYPPNMQGYIRTVD